MVADIIKDIKRVSIASILERNGYKPSRHGSKLYFISPFSNESNPSLVVYPDNTYYCFSSGNGGDVIDFMMKLEGVGFNDACSLVTESSFTIIPHNKLFKEPKRRFEISKYVCKDRYRIKEINDYASSRGLAGGYIPGVYYTRYGGV